MKKNCFSKTGRHKCRGEVTWRHRGVFPIGLDRCKAQSVYVSDVHGCASLLYTGLEPMERLGSEVGGPCTIVSV